MNDLRKADIHTLLGEGSPRMENGVESRNFCAYSETRKCILGVEIASGDFSAITLAERLPMLTAKSGAGLWMNPFRGLPEIDVSVPLDLLYLDSDYRVIETVEFYPTFRVSPACPPAASVLALPAHSIFASHTQPGDQLAIGLAEEIGRHFHLFPGSIDSAGAAQNIANAPPPERTAPERRPEAPAPATEVAPDESSKKKATKPKGWLQRLLNPDPPEPRKAAREAVPGLAAYFWTGGTPMAHTIRDISSTGLYMLTEERWYPGTLIQMTLKKTDSMNPGAVCSIALMAKVNRWGNDGVGLSFIVRDKRHPRMDEAPEIDIEDLERFFEQIGQGRD
jgi:hypothetical protein